MPAGVSTLVPSFPSKPLHCTAKPFMVLQKNGGDSSLPTLPVNLVEDSREDQEHEDANANEDENVDEEEDESSGASRATAIRRNLCVAEKISGQVNERQLSRSHEQLPKVSLGRLYSREHSKSQGNLREADQGCKCKSRHLSAKDFNELLSAKLRRIQRQNEKELRRRVVEASYAHHPRPFVSTVKSGEFLAPPPEFAQLLGLELPNTTASRIPIADLDLEGPHSRARFRQQLFVQSYHLKTNQHPHRVLRPVLPPTCALPGLCVSKHSCQVDQPPPFGNLMFDRRIVRGSTFAAPPPLVDGDQTARQIEARRRYLIRKRCQIQTTKATLLRIGTPPPTTGRKHEPVQTELFLQELFEKPNETEIGVQTDFFLKRPATPPSCQLKKGIDASTQIELEDLFDYDVEVQPILEVLVGKTIEQALIEVLEEEEIATLREQQRKFLELRAAEKAENERLEELDRRLRDEKDRSVKQHQMAVKIQQETNERVSASVLLTGYIAELLPAVLEGLKISGFLLDEIKADVKEDFMSWLMKEVKKEMGTNVEGREILEDIIKEIIENRAKIYGELGKDYDVFQKLKINNLEESCKMAEENVSKITVNDHSD